LRQDHFSGRLALQQRVFPAYRLQFFELLANACRGGLSLFAGDPLPGEGISYPKIPTNFNHYQAHNKHFRDPSSPLYLCWQPELVGWLASIDPDALILEANPRYLSSSKAIDWMHQRNRIVIGWGLGAPANDGTSILAQSIHKVQKRLRRRFLMSLDGIIAYSSRGADEYITEGFPPERVFISTNAVLKRPINPPPERPLDLYDSPKVLFVGRLQARKGVEILIKACAELPAQLHPQLWIVGDGPVREDLQSLANDIYPRTRFLGAKYGPELNECFENADLFILPGTGGLAVQEAMSFGLPVIVAEGDGTQEDLVHPENGWIIPPGDIHALKLTLITALSDIKDLRKKGKESFRVVKEEVNLEEMVDVFIYALNSLVRKT